MEWVRLGDLATYINGYAFKPTQWKKKGIPIIRIQNLTNSNSSYNYTDIDLDDRYKVSRGDILISWSATLDVYEWDEDLAYLNQHIFKVDFDKTEINKVFFKYFVKYALISSSKNAHGSTMKHLTRKNFEKIKIPKISLELQNKLANLLNNVTELIKIRKEQIQAYDDLIESLFFEMFNSLNTSDISLKKLIKFSKNSISDFTDYLDENYIGVEDIEKETGKILKIEKVSNSNIKSSKNYFTKDDVLYSRIRPNLNKVALPNFNGLVSSEVFVINCSDKINKYFLAYTLRSKKFVSYAMLNSSGANFPRVNKKTIEDYKVKVPPIELQNKFADYVLKIEEEKKKLNASLLELESLFDALMEDAFSGNLFKE